MVIRFKDQLFIRQFGCFVIKGQRLLPGIEDRPYVLITQVLFNMECFIKDADATIFINLSDEMDHSCRNWQWLCNIVLKRLWQVCFRVSIAGNPAEMLFAVVLIGIMLSLKFRRFIPQMHKISNPVFIPDELLKTAIQAFDMAVPPRFIEGDKDHLDSKIKTESDQFAEGPRMVKAATESSLIIHLQIPRHTIRFPVRYDKGKNTFRIFRIILLKVGVTGADIDSVNRRNLSVSGDIQRRDDIHLVKKTRVPCPSSRIINAFFIMLQRTLGFNQPVSFENSVDGGKARFILNSFAVEVLMNTDSTAKSVSGCRRVPTLESLSGLNDCIFNRLIDFTRFGMRCFRLVEIPLSISVLSLASINPFVNPVARPFKYRRYLNNRMTGRIQFKTPLPRGCLFVWRTTFLSIINLLDDFIKDIKCSRCYET